MQINFTDEIFCSETPYKILSVINSAIDHHHEIMIDFNGIHYCKWLAHCEEYIDPDVSALLAYAFGTSIFVGSKRFVKVVNTPTQSDQITFDELANVLLRTFYIYVENGRADKRFIYSLLPPEIRRDLQHQVKVGAITFENAGGITELAKKIVDDSNSRARLSLRAFALFDSDALVPGVPSKDALDAQRVCKALKIPHHCLSKRAIENYIPDDALLSYAETAPTEDQRNRRKRLARAVSRLSDDQRSHFHMKDGFSAPHGHQYSTLPAADRMTLSTGFGSHLSDCYTEGGIVDKGCLERSSGWPELENLVTYMMEAL